MCREHAAIGDVTRLCRKSQINSSNTPASIPLVLNVVAIKASLSSAARAKKYPAPAAIPPVCIVLIAFTVESNPPFRLPG